MTAIAPATRPVTPLFSSGPCAKRPGWTLEHLQAACLGRSHRSKPGKGKLKAVIDRSRALLGVPADYLCAIVPASDTGAFEMAMWSLLGARPCNLLVWESFSKDWAVDVQKQLRLKDARLLEAPYGQLPDLSQTNPDHDIVFVWNGTTSGVRVPDAGWIAEDRQGLTLCDATSATFAMDLPWPKLDVVTWSWQKVLGGEAAHGMIVLSPRAVQRLESYTPPWPLPKIFRMTSGGKVTLPLFEGATINTPSMLAVEDQLDALAWAERIGGLPALIRRSEDNFAVIRDWVEARDWIDFVAVEPATRSTTSICLRFTAPEVARLDAAGQAAFAKSVTEALESEGVAFDIDAYRDAPPGLRIWGGATVESADLLSLTQWLDWAYARALARLPAAA